MSALVNRARGEVALPAPGRDIRLCVTLGGLAELEAAFAARGWPELAERIGQAGPADMVIILAAIGRDRGRRLSVAEAATLPVQPGAVAAAIAEAFTVAFGDA
jgi:hypothetical protein